MPETTFTSPDLTTFLGLDALGLTAVGQLLTPRKAVVECRMPAGFEDPFCKACGAQGVARGTVARRLGPRAGEVAAHRAGCARAALRLHPLPASMAAGHEPAGWAQSPPDPLGGSVGAAGPCPGVHVRLPGGCGAGGVPLCGVSSGGVDCWMFFGQCLFVLQAAFVKSRKSLSTSSGVQYPRAE